MAKRRRKPNLKKPNSLTWRNKSDRAWKARIVSAGACAVCGRTSEYVQLHPHHIITCTNLRFRHDLRNGVCLCATHHTVGSYRENICAHGDLHQVKNFEDWLCNERFDQWHWWCKHRDDKSQHEKTYQECYEEIIETDMSTLWEK